ncbi:hypothetical protein HELRODRAFT_158780 [Helobdella robusta]|uniref:Uncharacterized protein n=1 Tax=Helobdella robusta TaxID=6412 RepID=T1EN91_HELRO|nr:hypothetical protein HELRODRAFT_158780 [Helobdella robusta]ESO12295.1 hypothetical protein HELRODRAFT_158780 [Helobdella robusta]
MDKKSSTDKASLKSTTISRHLATNVKNSRDSKKFAKNENVTQSVQFSDPNEIGKAMESNSLYSMQLQAHLREAVYENTYRMEPDPSCQFEAGKIDKILDTLLRENLKDAHYDSETSRQTALSMANKIMDNIKSMNIQRYKIIVVVNIGDFKDRPSIHFASRCLWNKPTDTYSSASYSNLSLYAVAIAFGIYYE